MPKNQNFGNSQNPINIETNHMTDSFGGNSRFQFQNTSTIMNNHPSNHSSTKFKNSEAKFGFLPQTSMVETKLVQKTNSSSTDIVDKLQDSH